MELPAFAALDKMCPKNALEPVLKNAQRWLKEEVPASGWIQGTLRESRVEPELNAADGSHPPSCLLDLPACPLTAPNRF